MFTLLDDLIWFKIKTTQFNISKTCDLSNHTKVPVTKRNITTTPHVDSFNGRFSVLSVLLTPLKLKIYNCSHRHHCESMIHNGSMMEIIISVNFIYYFHSALLHCGTPSWYIEIMYIIRIQDHSIKILFMKLQKLFFLISFVVMRSVLLVIIISLAR